MKPAELPFAQTADQAATCKYILYTTYYMKYIRTAQRCKNTGRASQLYMYTQCLLSIYAVTIQAAHNHMGGVHAGHLPPGHTAAAHSSGSQHARHQGSLNCSVQRRILQRLLQRTYRISHRYCLEPLLPWLLLLLLMMSRRRQERGQTPTALQKACSKSVLRHYDTASQTMQQLV